MRGVIVALVGGIAVIAIGLAVASILVEPPPASGGAEVVGGAGAPRAGSATTEVSPSTHTKSTVLREVPSGQVPEAPTAGPQEQASEELRKAPAPPRINAPPPESGGSRADRPPIPFETPRGPEPEAIAKDPTTHRGPEPPSDDPCFVPIYYDWVERRAPLSPDDVSRLTVRVTVENFTKAWWLRPDAPGNAYLWSVEDDIEATRIKHGEAGELSVRLRSVSLGPRELRDFELPLQMMHHPTGGVFGAKLLEAFDVTVDYQRGVLAFNTCP